MVHGVCSFVFFPEPRETKNNQKNNYPSKRPQTVCVRYKSRKSTDLDALRSREVTVTKVEIVVMVAVVSE